MPRRCPRAIAPSLRPEALPAVTVLSGSNSGLIRRPAVMRFLLSGTKVSRSTPARRVQGLSRPECRWAPSRTPSDCAPLAIGVRPSIYAWMTSPNSTDRHAGDVATGPLVLALGDSLTSGHGLPPGGAFPDRLQVLLRGALPGACVKNAGVSGNTTGDALRRLPRLLSALDRRPDLTIVELGANDLRRGVPPVETKANLDQIVAELRHMAIPVLLATVEPPQQLAAFARAYGSIYSEVADRHGISTHPFFPKGVLGHFDYVLADRIHPNAAAMDLVARYMLPAVLAELSTPLRRRSAGEA